MFCGRRQVHFRGRYRHAAACGARALRRVHSAGFGVCNHGGAAPSAPGWMAWGFPGYRGLALVTGARIVVLLGLSLHIPPREAGTIGWLVLLPGIVTRPLGGGFRRKIPVQPLFVMSLPMNAAGCFALASGSHSLALAVVAAILLGTGCVCPTPRCTRARPLWFLNALALPWDS